MSSGLMTYLAAYPFEKAFANGGIMLTGALRAADARLKKVQRSLGLEVPWRIAARHISSKSDMQPELAAFYWYIVEAHYRVSSMGLDNGPFMPCSIDWLEEVDAALVNLGVDLSLKELAFGPPPLSWVPRADDFPLVSYWSPDLIKAAHNQLKKRTLALEDPIGTAIETIKGWLDQAAQKRAQFVASYDCAIVGFYY